MYYNHLPQRFNQCSGGLDKCDGSADGVHCVSGAASLGCLARSISTIAGSVQVDLSRILNDLVNLHLVYEIRDGYILQTDVPTIGITRMFYPKWWLTQVQRICRFVVKECCLLFVIYLFIYYMYICMYVCMHACMYLFI